LLLLFSNPLIGFITAVEAGVSAGEGANLVDVDAVRSVGLGNDLIGAHASNVARSRVSVNPASKPRQRVVTTKPTYYLRFAKFDKLGMERGISSTNGTVEFGAW
jgi:hypothetical protein